MTHEQAPVILLTGASSGIGEAIAIRLVRRGCRVALLARRGERLAALQARIDPGTTQTLCVVGDVTVAEDRTRAVAETLARFGRIDGLVNNAGYGQRGPLEHVSLPALRANFETNVFSLIGLTQAALPALRQSGAGRIVNIGSVAGKIARPLTSIYDATKHALEALTDGLRGELKPWGLHVSLVRPGFIATEFIAAANEASAEALSELGPYAPYFAGHKEKSGLLWKLAGPPDVIAKLVEHALLSKYPKTHYAGPFHAKVFLFLRWLLPVFVFDRVVGLRRPQGS